jgi:hypothetical protein
LEIISIFIIWGRHLFAVVVGIVGVYYAENLKITSISSFKLSMLLVMPASN